MAAVKVAVWPTVLLLVLAGVAAMFFADDAHSGGLGWGVRMRIALALLLQSVGGGVAISGNMSESFGPFGGRLAGEATLSLVPLVVTAAWAGVLVFAARRVLRPAALPSGTIPMSSGTGPMSSGTGPMSSGAAPMSLGASGAPGAGMAGIAGVAGGAGMASGTGGVSRTGGTGVVEAVLRVAVLCGAGSFVLGLLAQPSYDGVELSSAPFLSLLWSFLLAALVGGVATARAEAGAWLAARPAWQLAVGALRTALFALLTVVTLAGIVTVVTMLATAKQDISGGAVVAMLVLLPNIGALALAMAWGAPLNAEWTLPDIPFLDPSGRQSIGYGELGDQGGGWTLFGVIVGGLVCALLVGFLVVRRSADRREQLLSAGLFVVSLMALVLVAGASASAAFRAGGGYGDGYGGGYGEGYGGYGSGYGGGESLGAHGEIAVGGAETLLFALLWVFGAVLVVSYLRRMTGAAGAPPLMPLMPPTSPLAPGPGVAPGAAAFVPAPVAGGAPAAGGAPVQPPAAGDDPVPSPEGGAPARPSVPVPSVPVPSAPVPPGAPVAVPDVPPVPPASSGALEAAPSDAPVADAPVADAPAEARSRPRVVTWVALALAAFLVGGGATAGGLYFLAHRDSGSHDAGNQKEAGNRNNTGNRKDAGDPKSDTADKAGGASASASPSPSPAPTTTGDPAGGPTPGPTAGLPDGFVQKYDPYGFSLAVKSDWTRSVKGTQVDYTAPVGKQYLRIGVIAHAPTSSYGNFENMEKGAEKRTNYQRVELKKNTFAHRPGARWEFTYVNDTGNTVHAIDQAYVAEDGTEYSVYYECLEALYDPENDKVFSTALSTWSVSDVDVD
ncbi:hypothetical protein [Streptomyces bugieae]|uniref:Serine/threonine protein kinase n=1 Tax=Streptomyces bugieae TaxID=3098223 RepID=A0ABU7NZS4_9ACTN|nr:hypothetical protein [Streptomyces sp. DSM 41528]